jgi:hypothetical protein
MKDTIKVKGQVTVELIKSNGEKSIISDKKLNLLTYAGRDWMHSQIYSTGTTNESKYIALSTDSTDPDESDTILTDEIVSGGLERTTGTVTHVEGETTTIITNTFIASATHTGVIKAGLFTEISGGTLVHENLFLNSITLESSDNLVVTWTITLA